MHFLAFLIKTNFKEEDRCFSTLFLFQCTTWDLKLLYFCLFGFFFFFSWLDPKKWNKKYLMKALLFEIAGCYKNYCKSLMSSCLPSILLFWVIMQAVISENCALFIFLSLDQTPCAWNSSSQPQRKKVLGPKLRLRLSQTPLLEICINVEEKIISLAQK